MELLYEYKTKKKTIYIFFSVILFLVFLFTFVPILGLIAENQKLEIECLKSKDICRITKGVHSKVHMLKYSNIKVVKLHCVGCHRGVCNYDIEILFHNTPLSFRILGPGLGSVNYNELNRISNDFNNYLTNDKDYFYIRRKKQIFIPFDVYLALLGLFGVPWLLYKFLPIRQKIFIDEEADAIYIEKSNIFNRIYFKKRIKIKDINSFYVDKSSIYQFLMCYIKNKPLEFLRLDDKNIADKLCQRLNNMLLRSNKA